MPVKVAVANEHRLFLTYIHGPVPLSEVYGTADRIAALATGSGTYRGLVIFERDVDLSEWDGDALRDMIRRAADLYRHLGLQRGDSAAVVNLVPEAHQVLRLWNALCAFNWDIDMAFNVFWDLGPAMRFLGLPAELRQKVAEMATPASS